MNFNSTINEKIIYNNTLEKDLRNILYANMNKIIEELKYNNLQYIEQLIKKAFDNNGINIDVEVQIHEKDGEPRGWWWNGIMHINLFYSDVINKKLIDDILTTCLHEYIHREQDQRRVKKNKEKDIDIPNEDSKKFTSHEIMAYANTFVLRAKNAGLTRRELFDLINSGKEVKFDNIFMLYKKYKNKLPPRWYNKFVRYIYDYIGEVYEF